MTQHSHQELSLRTLWTGSQKKSLIILLLTTLLIVTWKYYGTPAFYNAVLVPAFGWKEDSFFAALFSFLSAFVLFGVLPVLVIRIGFHESLRDYGVTIGDWKFGLLAFLVMAPVMILLTYPSASNPEFLAEYPLNRSAGASASAFALHVILYAFYYAGYEMLMRGFLQCGLRGIVGDWNSVLVQTAISCLFHIGKPTGEIYSSILGGLLWGFVVLRTRSLLYVLLVHWLLGVSLDYFICFGL